MQNVAQHNTLMAEMDHSSELMRLNTERMEEMVERLNKSMAEMDDLVEQSRLNNKKMEEAIERLMASRGGRGVADLLAQRDRERDVEDERRRKKSKCPDDDLFSKEAGDKKGEVSGCEAGLWEEWVD